MSPTASSSASDFSKASIPYLTYIDEIWPSINER